MLATSNNTPDPKALDSANTDVSKPQLHFDLVIQKTPGESLGIEVTYGSTNRWTSNGVLISKVYNDGLVGDWNAQSQDPHRVQPGDLICQVNNVPADPMLIVQEIRTKQRLAMRVMRCERPKEGRLGELAPEPADLVTMLGSPPMPCFGARPEQEPPQRNAVPGAAAPAPPPAAPTEPGRRLSPRVEALLPELAALGDKAFLALLRTALGQRRLPLQAVLGQP